MPRVRLKEKKRKGSYFKTVEVKLEENSMIPSYSLCLIPRTVAPN